MTVIINKINISLWIFSRNCWHFLSIVKYNLTVCVNCRPSQVDGRGGRAGYVEKETISIDVVAVPAHHQQMLRDVTEHIIQLICNTFSRVAYKGRNLFFMQSSLVSVPLHCFFLYVLHHSVPHFFFWPDLQQSGASLINVKVCP